MPRTPTPTRRQQRPPSKKRTARATVRATAPSKPAATHSILHVEVVWGDVTKVAGDVHVVGHYVGVVPQGAEWKLDCAISGVDPNEYDNDKDWDKAPLLLTELTKRGALRGALGEVIFFPWGQDRALAIAGMGRPGTFHEAQLRVLARSVAQATGRLAKRPVVASLLIGSGAGNLPVPRAVAGLVMGFLDAIDADARLRVRTLRIVELNLDRALEVLDELQGNGKTPTEWRGRITVPSRLIEDEGGTIPKTFGYSMLLAAIANSSGLPAESDMRMALKRLIDGQPPKALPADLQDNLFNLSKLKKDLRRLALDFPIRRKDSSDQTESAARFTFSNDGREIRASAITDTTTVTERTMTTSPVLERAIIRLQNPVVGKSDDYGAGLLRLIVPEDLHEALRNGVNPVVIEVDRAMARAQWEMLPGEEAGDKYPLPLGVQRPVARQLRTQYSPRAIDFREAEKRRALVIGDPGDEAHSLEFAQREAQVVAECLERGQFEVELRVGAPDRFGGSTVTGTIGKRKGQKLLPADLLETLDLLLSGTFDLVHFSGHGFIDPLAPDRSGWVFAEGHVLAAAQLAGMALAPGLIVANACLTSQLASAEARPGQAGALLVAPTQQGSQLVALLADEFFKRGVADYIGTAWEIAEGAAIEFATTFYDAILKPPTTIGGALKDVRTKLFDKRAQPGYGSVWGAYQHYGDPTRKVRVD